MRPYATAVSGYLDRPPLFNDATRVYELRFRHTDCAASTFVFIPAAVHYPEGYDVYLTDGTYTVQVKPPEQGGWHVLSYAHTQKHELHILQLAPKAAKAKRRGGRSRHRHIQIALPGDAV